MKRKAMVLAVGAALAAPSAYAQYKSPAGSSWEFYAKFYPELTLTSGGGATPVGTQVSTLSATPTGQGAIIKRWEMQISNTYLGFRGNKDLGGGLKAIAQLEQTVQIDEGNQGASFASRDSFAGLSSDSWGTIRLGNMDTPFKKYGDVTGFLGISSGNLVSPNNVMRRVSNSGASGFNLRRANAVDYATKEFGGVQVGVQYSIGNPTESGAGNAGINPSANRNPHVISLGVKWEQGPFYVALAGEKHYDLFGGSGLTGGGSVAATNAANPAVNSEDTAIQATSVFKLGVHTIEFDVISKQYKEKGQQAVNGFQEYKNLAYEVVLESRWTNQWRTSLAYIKANAGSCSIIGGASCSTSGMEGTQMNAGVAYFFDPSVYLFLIYSRLLNGESARYNNSQQSPAVGEDITQTALGLTYIF
jgi:predicted porin